MLSAASRRIRQRPNWAVNGPPGGAYCYRRLLPVAYQNLIAGPCQLGAVLLKTGQHGQVVLIHDGTTIFLNIVSTGLLLLRCAATLLRRRLLGDSPGGSRQRQQRDYQEKVTHRVPFF